MASMIKSSLVAYEKRMQLSSPNALPDTHATSVNQTGFPTLTDFIAVGTKTKMSEKRCREIFDEVYGNCGDLLLNDIR